MWGMKKLTFYDLSKMGEFKDEKHGVHLGREDGGHDAEAGVEIPRWDALIGVRMIGVLAVERILIWLEVL